MGIRRKEVEELSALHQMQTNADKGEEWRNNYAFFVDVIYEWSNLILCYIVLV